MIKAFFAREAAKLKAMSFEEQRWYIWTYYKLPIMFTVFGILAIGSLINTWFINPPKRDYVYIAWQAGHVNMMALDNLGEDLSVIVENPDRYQVAVRSYVISDDLDPQMIQALITRFHAMLSVGGIHAIISTYEGVMEQAEVEIIRPICEVVDILREWEYELYTMLADRLLTITYTPDEQEHERTGLMAINVSGAPLLVEHGLSSDGLYLTLVVNATPVEGIASTIMAMFGFGDFGYDE